MENPNAQQELIIRGARSRPARLALQEIDRLKAEIAIMRKNGDSERAIKNAEKEGLAAIKADLADASTKERERISARIKELEGQYTRSKKENHAAAMIDLAEKQLMFRAMSNDELYEAARPYLSSPTGENPMLIDSIAAEMRSRTMPEHAAMRELVKKHNYRQPYLHTEEGQTLTRQNAFYSQAKPGEFLIDAVTASGKVLETAASVDQAYGA